jgi:hypothetical protein
MGALHPTPVGKALENANITLGGYIEGAYTASFQHPPGNVIAGRVFDTKHERVVLDQADFFIDRPVDYGAAAKNHTFDIGGHLELVYGWDAGAFHSDGLYDNPTSSRKSSQGAYYSSRTQPENQFDIEQAYVDFALPVGQGMRIRVGKIVTLLGYEVISPTGNAFYSHSYLFGFAVPLTNTGIIAEYKVSDDWTFDAGVTRGENQSVLDNNGSPDMISQATFTPQENDALKKWKFIANLEVGPEAAADNHDWWTVIDLQAIYTVNEKLSVALNADYGDAPHALVTKSAQWGGLAGYAGYTINDYVTANARLEWYEDAQGFTLGTPGSLNVYEATVGASIKPFPASDVGQNLVIRPEIRGDYADKNFFNAGTKHFQATFGLDAYFKY